MGSSIEWTDETINPVVGCQRVSPGCENCYAEKVAHRGMSPQHRGLTVVGKAGVRWSGEVRLVPEALEKPLRWRKPRRIFVCSMADLFHEKVPFEFAAAVFGVAAACPQHTFQILTKRPRRMREFFKWIEHKSYVQELDAVDVCASLMSLGLDAEVRAWPLTNVHLGVSVEDQQRADERIPVLLECPAALRFLSCEPLLGSVDLDRWVFDRKAAIRRAVAGPLALNKDQADAVIADVRIGWVIVGGESGPGARECDIAWVRSIVQQCKAADVPVFVKQLGARPKRQCSWCYGTSRDELLPGNATASRCLDCQGSGSVALKLKSRKGADPTEWPEDLRVQQMPRSPDDAPPAEGVMHGTVEAISMITNGGAPCA